MSKKRMVLVFIVIVVLLSVVPVTFLINAVKKSETTEEQDLIEEYDNRVLSPEDTIRQFAEVIYTYDTRERPFYEGAEQYMTEEAYETLVPLQDPEESGESPVQMTSKLIDLSCYYSMSNNSPIEVIVDVEYTLSGMGDFRNHQLIKVELINTDGWKISECTVLATIEQ